MTANATDERARVELWLSFRSLLRSYLSAASVGSDVPQALLFELESGRTQIVGTTHTIELAFEASTGAGYWAVYRARSENAGEPFAEVGMLDPLDEGNFRLHLDAEFEWSGKPGKLAMDQVAEALAMLAIT